MKAVLCKEYGPPQSLVVEDVDSLSAGPGQVVVSVRAAGVNFPDTLIIQGKYQFQPPLPFSPGGEVAGVVKETGDGVEGYQPGDRVIAVTGFGGFAEEVVCGPEQLVMLPDEMNFSSAAGLLFTYGTGIYALKDRGTLRAGESLVVLGAAGGVGLAAIEIGKALGAKVIAAASSEERLAVCREHGADDTIDYSTEDLKMKMRELTGGEGADVVFDPVGGPYSEQAIRSTAWGGRFLVIGFAAGEIPKIPLNLTLLKSCAIVGVFWGAFTARDPARNRELIAELFDWHAQGKIRPHVSATYPLQKAGDALDDLLGRRVMGKAVLLVD